MKKNKIYLLLLLLPYLIFGCDSQGQSEQTSVESAAKETLAQIDRSKLQLLKVNMQNKQMEELISGRVIAKNQTQLVSEVQGLLLPTSVPMKEGVKFRKGDQLISIEAQEFSFNLKSLKSAFLNTLTGMMADLKSDYPENFEAWLAYLEQIDIDKPLAELPETKSKSEQFFITSRGIYTSYFGLKAQEERQKKYTLFAPYNGIITHSLVDVGGLVSPGQPLGTIISRDEFELESGISLKVSSRLAVGDTITFTSNEVPGTWLGTVVRISGVVDAQTQNVAVYFRISGNDILPGMYLQGKFASDSYSEVYVIPNAALGRDQGVLVLHQDLIISKAVETIQVFQDSTLVRGLAENDQVILTSFTQPMAGKKVAL